MVVLDQHFVLACGQVWAGDGVFGGPPNSSSVRNHHEVGLRFLAIAVRGGHPLARLGIDAYLKATHLGGSWIFEFWKC